MSTVKRLLSEPMRSSTAPVLLLEGARGVGKTFLAEHLLHPAADYTRVDLSQPTTLEYADTDLEGWLASLGSRVIIDEAQLLPGLQLSIKRIVDAPDFEGQYILTGSASLPQDELGGSSPFTRRSESFQLRPLTRWELAGATGSVVDLLFNADLESKTAEPISHDALLEICKRGGFPTFAAPGRYVTANEVIRRVPGDIDRTLTDRLLPRERFEASVARSVFDSMMKNPGAILTYEGFSRTLGIDRRTVARYADLLRRLHLIFWVPNLASRGTISDAPARSKVYPVDTSFAACEALSQATRSTLSPEAIGLLVEALVVAELTASASWSKTRPRAYYWRSPKQRHEVDLVLVDSSGSRVGIEIKSASHVGLSDIKGLQALQKEAPEQFLRGFVIYPGERMYQLSESIWALPLNAIFQPGILGKATMNESSMPSPEMTSEVTHKLQQSLGVTELPKSATLADASLFLSYAHKDDEYLNGGIIQFVKDLTSAYETLTGKEINVFIDKENIPWGQPWDQHLLDNLDQTAFLLCAASPRYLLSKSCQQELSHFRASADIKKNRKVLPFVAVDLKLADPDNLTLQTLQSLQFVEFDQSLDQILDSDNTKGYSRFVKQVARQLVDVVRSYQAGPEPQQTQRSTEETSSINNLDLVSAASQVESSMAMIQGEMIDYGSALQEIGSAFQDLSLSASPTPQEAQKALQILAVKLNAPTKMLNTAVANISTHYSRFDTALGAMVSFAEIGNTEMKESLLSSLVEAAGSLQIPDLGQLQSLITMLSMLSAALRPTAEAIAAAVSVIETMQASMKAWIARLER